MQFGAKPHCRLKGFHRGQDAGLSASDLRVGLKRDILTPFLPCRFQTFPDQALVLAVYQNRFSLDAEKFLKCIAAVNQHSSCGGTHKDFDTSHTVSHIFQNTEDFFRISVVRSDVETVIRMASACCEFQFFRQSLCRHCCRRRVRHIYEGCHSSGESRSGFRLQVRLLCQSRLPEMHVRVNPSGKNIFTCDADSFESFIFTFSGQGTAHCFSV